MRLKTVVGGTLCTSAVVGQIIVFYWLRRTFGADAVFGRHLRPVLEPNLVSTLAEQERDYLAGVSRVRGRRRYLHTLALWLCGVSSKICSAVGVAGECCTVIRC